MKKILTFSVAAALSLCCNAKTLKVYSVEGNVTKKDGASWVKIAKSNTVSDNETVKINPASSLRVLDPSTHQIYTFSSEGTHSVSALLKQAAHDNSSLGSKIAAESKRQGIASASKSHKAVGAAKRATLDEEIQEALYTTLVSGFETGTNCGNLQMTKSQAGDDLIYLSLTNTGEDVLYVNVFTRGDDGHWVAVYEFDNENPALMLAPQSSVTMEHMPLFDDGSSPFVAVGFNDPFDGAELTDMFAEDFEPGETSADGVSLFFLK